MPQGKSGLLPNETEFRSNAKRQQASVQGKERFVTTTAALYRRRSFSTQLVGAFICWTTGVGLSVLAVVFSVNGGVGARLCGLAMLLFGACICGFARILPSHWKLRLAAMLIAALTATLIAEGLLRLLTPYPVNTSSNMTPHPALGYVLSQKLDDVDEAGFRNDSVLTRADIVAIGDSHTQGLNAAAHETWPRVLEQMTGQTVYNMGVGGYGPLQYRILVDEALTRDPNRIIVGLYLGNDVADVGRGIRHRHSTAEIDNSLRYSIKYHTAVGSAITQLIKRSALGRPHGFAIPQAGNPTWVSHERVRYLTSEMDLQRPEIKSGFEETVRILGEVARKCRQRNVILSVILIPTRESVYVDAAQTSEAPHLRKLAQLAAAESHLLSQLKTACADLPLNTIDLLPALSDAVRTYRDVYPDYDDGHPLARGYHQYAAAVASSLE